MNTSKPIKQEASELVSALMDNEASEQEIDTLLTAMSEDKRQQESIVGQLLSYSCHQYALKEGDNVPDAEGLLMKVSQAIKEESNVPSAKVTSIQQAKASKEAIMPTKWAIASGFAVAASVAFMVVLTGNSLLGPADQTPAVALVEPELGEANKETVAQQQIDSLQINTERLQRYLRAHAEEATQAAGQGMIPMARVVNYTLKKDNEDE